MWKRGARVQCEAKAAGTLNSLCKEALDAEHDTNVRCNAKGHHCSCSYIPNLSKFAGDASDAQLHRILTWTSLITQPWRGPPFRFQRRHDLLSANWAQGMIQPATQPLPSLCHHYAITMPLCHFHQALGPQWIQCLYVCFAAHIARSASFGPFDFWHHDGAASTWLAGAVLCNLI